MARRTPDEIREIVSQIAGRRKGLGIPTIPYKTPRSNARTDDEIANALIHAGGRYTYAAVILGVSPNTVRNRVSKSEMLSDLVENIREARIDVAEQKLDKKISEERWQAIQFLLETQGKSRGYVKRQEVSGPGGDRLVFEFSDGHQE